MSKETAVLSATSVNMEDMRDRKERTLPAVTALGTCVLNHVVTTNKVGDAQDKKSEISGLEGAKEVDGMGGGTGDMVCEGSKGEAEPERADKLAENSSPSLRTEKWLINVNHPRVDVQSNTAHGDPKGKDTYHVCG